MSNTNKHKKQLKTTALILLLSTAFVITIFPSIIAPSKAALDGWTLVYDARNLKAYPNLREYVWQKNTIMPPNGQYDKIGLHRLVNTGTTTKGVVLMFPGTYLNGEGWTSNPPTDNFTKTENDSQAMYWANRGFDVYALDYRTHFVPTNLNSTQLGFMATWGYDQWISDIKEAVTKVKEVSGASKIFIAGFSFGGFASMYYSTKYWQEDIKGIILLDGGANIKTANATNSYNLTAVLKQENDTKTWALEAPNLPGSPGGGQPSGWLFQKQYAAQNPGAPAEYPPGTPLTPTINPANNKTWANITEYFAYSIPQFNSAGNNLNITVLSQVQADWDRYWPDRLNLERNAINDWTNCPDVTYDFNEYYSTMSLPIISFTSELFGLSRSLGALNTTNLDANRTVLRGYGHMDVYCGVYSARDVSEPVYQWMINHLPPQLITTVTQTATTIPIGYAATFYAIVSGGAPPFTYQWYQGLTPVGNNPQLTQYPNIAGVYTYKCKITDANGATTISNPLTLSVATLALADPTKQTQPTQTPTAKPTNSPTPTTAPTLSPSPTSSLSPSPTPNNEALSLSTNATYAIALIVAVIVVITTIVLVLRKKAK